MTKPVWSHVLALSAWTLKKESSYSQLSGNLSSDYKYLQASQTPQNKAFHPMTVKDILLMSFAITDEHACFTLGCVQAKIQTMLINLRLSYIVQHRSGEHICIILTS